MGKEVEEIYALGEATKNPYETKWLIGWDVHVRLAFCNAMDKLDGEDRGKMNGVEVCCELHNLPYCIIVAWFER